MKTIMFLYITLNSVVEGNGKKKTLITALQDVSYSLYHFEDEF
jgi:hypothetical protein